MSDEKQIIYEWPGRRQSVAGGTRTEIKLDRPWQVEIQPNPETCPFCTHQQKDLKIFDEGGGWRLIENAFTPYRVNGGIHNMLIPSRCWPIEELRELGGEAKLTIAFELLQKAVEEHPDRALWINFHVGYQAGQNVPHLHYHIVQYSLDKQPGDHLSADLALKYSYAGVYQHLVFQADNRTIFGVGGVRAGQCFIIPKDDNVTLPELAWPFWRFVNICNQKYKSKQGLGPDYNTSIVMKGGRVLHGLYTPILNNYGSAEALAFYDSEAPISMPWTHEKTVEYLKS